MSRRKKKQSKKKITAQATNWLKSLEPRFKIVLFCLGFMVLMGLYYYLSFKPFFIENINNPILKGYASAGHQILKFFGKGTSHANFSISSPEFSINVGRGCDAVSPTVLLLVAVLLFPVAFRWKWQMLIIGPLILAAINLVRVVTLFLIGIKSKQLFEVFHTEIWQGIFIFLVFLGWAYWVNWATKKQAEHENI